MGTRLELESHTVVIIYAYKLPSLPLQIKLNIDITATSSCTVSQIIYR